MSELSGPALNAADHEREDNDDRPLEETFAHPVEGEQEESLESDETLSEDEKRGRRE